MLPNYVRLIEPTVGNLIHSSKTTSVCPLLDLLGKVLSMTILSAHLFLLAWVKTTNHNYLVYIHLLGFHQISNINSECRSIRYPQVMKSQRITQISPNHIPKHICWTPTWKIRSHRLHHPWPPRCPRCPRCLRTPKRMPKRARRKCRWRSWKMLGNEKPAVPGFNDVVVSMAMGNPQNGWFISWKIPSFEMDDDWGYPHLWTPPYGVIFM